MGAAYESPDWRRDSLAIGPGGLDWWPARDMVAGLAGAGAGVTRAPGDNAGELSPTYTARHAGQRHAYQLSRRDKGVEHEQAGMGTARVIRWCGPGHCVLGYQRGPKVDPGRRIPGVAGRQSPARQPD